MIRPTFSIFLRIEHRYIILTIHYFVYKTVSYTHLKFVGRQEQAALQSYYDKIDVLLMPSSSEGFGLTAIEGMARGCVLVASNTGGLPEVVREGYESLRQR